jgi:hypothetical protein
MFISKYELTKIRNQIASLQDLAIKLQGEIIELQVAQEQTNAKLVKPKKKPLTPEQKAKQREYVRAYNARKKAEKAQQVAA